MVVTIEYFTDILCVGAWGGQVRIDRLKQSLGSEIELHYRFVPIFAAAHNQVLKNWSSKGGFEGFSHHLSEATQNWDHVTLSPGVWSRTLPASSTGIHAMLKAVQLMEVNGEISPKAVEAFDGRSCFEEFAWRLRDAFFSSADNISDHEVRAEIAEELGLPLNRLIEMINSGEAFAALRLDDEARERYKVPGSPTLVLNEGRQLLYGNVGYRIMEANIRELLHNPAHGEASWC